MISNTAKKELNLVTKNLPFLTWSHKTDEDSIPYVEAGMETTLFGDNRIFIQVFSFETLMTIQVRGYSHKAKNYIENRVQRYMPELSSHLLHQADGSVIFEYHIAVKNFDDIHLVSNTIIKITGG